MDNNPITSLPFGDEGSESRLGVPALLPIAKVRIGSSDPVWSGLLCQHLNARGLSSVECPISDILACFQASGDTEWLVIDGGWPTTALQDAVTSLATNLPASSMKTVLVVDELIGKRLFANFTPDQIVPRSSDMRTLVRDLLTSFDLPSAV